MGFCVSVRWGWGICVMCVYGLYMVFCTLAKRRDGARAFACVCVQERWCTGFCKCARSYARVLEVGTV